MSKYNSEKRALNIQRLTRWTILNTEPKRHVLDWLISAAKQGESIPLENADPVLAYAYRNPRYSATDLLWITVAFIQVLNRAQTRDMLVEATARRKEEDSFEEAFMLLQGKFDLSFEELLEAHQKRTESIQNISNPKLARESVDALRSAHSKLESGVKLAELPLDDRDVELASLWTRQESVSLLTVQEETWSDDAKVLSARRAELALQKMYRESGSRVRDTAIEQLEDSGAPNAAWRSHDIEVDAKKIDVKNTRQSRRNYFSQHIVREKKGVLAGPGVTISAVVSPVGANESSMLWLGELEIPQLSNLKDRFEDGVFRLGFEPSNLDRQRRVFLAPWLYDLPDRFYGEFDKAIRAIVKLPHQSKLLAADGILTRHHFNSEPLALLAGSASAKGWRGEFLSGLKPEQGSARLPLPYAYLSVLTHYLRAARRGFPREFHPAQYRRLVFIWSRTAPFGALDPMNLVDHLITNLETLHTFVVENKALQDFLKACTSIDMRADGILMATSGGERRTLMSYCGNCHKDPLILGRNLTCNLCKKLRCSFVNRDDKECGHCSDSCSKSGKSRNQ